jgi:predicted acetyltransferase
VTFETRIQSSDDMHASWNLLSHAFGGSSPDADRDVELSVVDPKRFYGTYDGNTLVATGGSFALTMAVPGAHRPVAGVTWVGVLPTHRRRGLLTGLMRRLIDDLHDSGEPVAALFASEGAIYQRFGYGPAAWHASIDVPSKSAFNRPVSAGDLRIATPDAATLAPVFERATRGRVGWQTRDDAWWAYRLYDPEHRRSSASQLTAVLAEGAGGVEGYALYSTTQDWGPSHSASYVSVRELVAVDAETTARLWRYLLDIDLMKTVKAWGIGVDDPLLHLLAEPRAAKASLKDNLYVRLVDVPTALAGRSYAADVDVVLDVVDEYCPWNAGRWRLTGGTAGATCTSTSDGADLTVNAGDLGAAYLGGTSLVARAAAGHVVEHRPGALTAASVAFGWPGSAPYCPMVF